MFESIRGAKPRGIAAFASLVLLVFLAGAFVGCSTVPANGARLAARDPELLKQVMARKDKIILLSSRQLDPMKPVLVLLHGATDDPTEMMDIVEEWSGQYNVLLFAHNYHQSVEKVGAHLVGEMKLLKASIEPLKAANKPIGNLSVVTYSYSAAIFREAVIMA